jgi:hypothetical protein
MTPNIQKIFKKLKNAEPSAVLEEKILKNIAYKSKWRLQRRLIFADALMLGSLGAFVFIFMNFWNGIAKSEFWILLKLVFTDTGVITGHIGEFLISLLETLPAAHFAAILAPMFLLMIALWIYFSNNNLRHHSNY